MIADRNLYNGGQGSVAEEVRDGARQAIEVADRLADWEANGPESEQRRGS